MRAFLVAVLCVAATTAAQPKDPASERVERRLGKADALEEAGRLDEAEREYEAARAEAERIGDRRLVADSLIRLGYVRYYRGDTNAALIDLRRGYDLAAAIRWDEGRRTALECIAHVYADAKLGQYDRAIEYYRQLLPEYETAGAATSVADTLFNLGSTYDQKGDFGGALEWYQRALKSEQKLRRLDEVAYVQRSIGMTLVKLDRAAEGLPLLDEALRFFMRTRNDENANHVRQSRGIAYRRLGRFDAAIADLEATQKYFEATKNSRFLEKTMDELALAYSGNRRWEDAFRTRTTHAALQRQLAEKLREEHTSRLRVQFDAEKKETENRALLREAAAASRIRKLQTIILILGAAIIAVLIFFAVRLIRDGRRMRVMALTDELTRLPNRRHLLAVADEQLRQARNGGAPFSLIAIDIDHFKRINDTWGHAAGDVVLQRVADACRNMLRPTDRLGRTGGEEFTTVLPSTRLRDAIFIAERLRASVEALDFQDLDPALRVTISLGIAEWNSGDETLSSIARRADDVLYRAKANGRNCAVAAG